MVLNELFPTISEHSYSESGFDPSYSLNQSTAGAAPTKHKNITSSSPKDIPKVVCPFQKISQSKKVRYSDIVNVCVPQNTSNYPSGLMKEIKQCIANML